MYVLLSVESCYVLGHVMLHLVVSVMHEYSVLHMQNGLKVDRLHSAWPLSTYCCMHGTQNRSR